MQSVVQDRRTGGADVGASVCRPGQETPRQSGGNSTPVGAAASWAHCASLPVSTSRVHLRCAEQPSRTSEPPGGPSSRARISSTPVTTSGPRRHAVHQPEAQAAAQRPAAAIPSESGRNRRSAATSRETFDASAETRNTRGIFVVRIVRSLVEGLRRCVPRYSARRCHGIPLPRALADVRHFLDALYYEEVCFLILRSCLTIVHTGVFLYSCVWEKPFKTHVTVALLLGILSVLTLVRVLCQYQIVKALARLRWAWWQRTILPDFAKLLRSPLWQCQRILFLVSFSFYFVALHLAYYRGIATNVETSNAPVLVRYVSVVVLVFLSVLGPHILMLVIVCASLFVCWCASAADIEQLLVEEPRGAGRALPARLLQMMHEEQWTPPERDHRRSSDSNRNSTTSSSSRRGSDATPDLDKQAPEQQSKRGRHLLTQITGLSDADQQYSETRKHRCGKKTEENRATDDGNEVKYGSEFICAICLTEFREGDVVRRLPCSHVFHSACITRWLSSHASCPLRCYVNFFIGHINRPSYEASRCFRMLASQLLRRPRSRFLASLRQRHQRHVGQQRPTPQVQPQQTQQREGEQGHQEGQEHQQQLAEEEREEPQGDLRDRAEFLEVSPCVGCGAADARAISAVAETQTLAEELSERAVSSCAGDEGKEDVFWEKQEGEERMPMNKAPRHSLEGSREGVGEIGAEQVPSEGGGNFVMHRCCVDDTRIQEEDNGMYYVSLRNADASRREEGGNVGAAEVTLTGNMPQRTSSVQVTRKALEGSFLRASMDSTVALSVRSRDGSSELSPSHSDNRIFSQESDMWT